MRVKIGPYTSDLIPIRRWENSYERFRSGSYTHEEEDWKWFDKIAYKVFDKLFYIFLPINRWSNTRKRKIKVHIDNYDVWSADHTLALVIHPLLLRLQKVQQGSPNTDAEDVPENLRPTDIPSDDNGYVDNTHFDRWNYILGEMIWAFEQLTKDDRGEDQFHHNSEQLELISKPIENSKYSSLDLNYQKDPTKPKYWVDNDAKKLHNDRIANGIRLFAKYYLALWD